MVPPGQISEMLPEILNISICVLAESKLTALGVNAVSNLTQILEKGAQNSIFFLSK